MAETETRREITETFPVVDGLALRLSFTPDAIREHFEDDFEDATTSLTDAQLETAGALALTDDGLYEAFHNALTSALETVTS